ncbi:hypothetical protein BAG01nite_29640 [Brevibacillus agri]|uniref:Uncharacterized protein n=1 Tax=Brevibacillus agri TaxID=51101 RepID=A0ABQ0SSI9_9BACL|nr:hypothetical protein BAG01nite_29640 [Brevibacillus agri]
MLLFAKVVGTTAKFENIDIPTTDKANSVLVIFFIIHDPLLFINSEINGNIV